MRGLLVKDIRLLSNQKQFFLSMGVVIVMLVAAGQDTSFVVGYCTMLSIFLSISTISYDEFNNGYAFLFTMPVSRRGYVAEKYLFSVLAGGGVWLLTSAAGAVYSWVSDPEFHAGEWFAVAAVIFLVMGMILFVALPVEFKFGVEKGKVAIMIVSLGCFAVLMLAGRMSRYMNMPRWNLAWVSSIGTSGWLMIGAIGFVVAGCLSLALSIRIVEKKQF